MQIREQCAVELDFKKKRPNTMQCIRPLKAAFTRDGDITYSSKTADPSQLPFQFECRKCLPCRLNIAREKAIRAVHEAKMHPGNIFLTLTYNEQSLTSPRLNYGDFQNFMKRLRKTQKQKINYMVTGEYGEKTKRPHWHALIFNYWPVDTKHYRTSDRGDKIYNSKNLQKLWGKGMIEFGEITMESAGYTARYAAKKLVHGKDQEHDYHPIHKTSSKYGIGRSWIEKYWKHTFKNGFVVLPNGQTSRIPRYYIDWLKQEKPDEYLTYVTEVLPKIIKKAEIQSRKEELEHITQIMNYKGGAAYPLKTRGLKERVLQTKFKTLQERLKL